MKPFEEDLEYPEFGEKKKPQKTGIKDVLNGSVLTRDSVVKQFPYIFFLAFLAIIYIGNRYHAEQLVRTSVEMQKELKELRSEAIATASELMYISKQSEVAKMVDKKGLELKESIEPPKKIVIKE